MINHGQDFAKLELILPITGDLNLAAKNILEAYTNNKTTAEIVSRIFVVTFGYNGKISKKDTDEEIKKMESTSKYYKNNGTMTHLIEENKFEELNEALINSTEFKIHSYLLDVLNNKMVEIDGESFSAERYQEEFLEGLQIFEALIKSNIDKIKLDSFLNILVELAFKMGDFIHLMSQTAMNKGVYLSDIEELYQVNPIIRNRLQDFNVFYRNLTIKINQLQIFQLRRHRYLIQLEIYWKNMKLDKICYNLLKHMKKLNKQKLQREFIKVL
jgi:hypothetical protein